MQLGSTEYGELIQQGQIEMANFGSNGSDSSGSGRPSVLVFNDDLTEFEGVYEDGFELQERRARFA